MTAINTDFLKEFRLPANKLADLPSTRFEDGLSSWVRLRGHELKRSTPPDYEYYFRALHTQQRFVWSAHDRAMGHEMKGEDFGDTFDEIGTNPETVLAQTARALGWRLVPFARWAALKLNDQAFAHEVEATCRDWSLRADAVFRGVSTDCSRSRKDIRAAHLLVEKLRQEAGRLETAVFNRVCRYIDMK